MISISRRTLAGLRLVFLVLLALAGLGGLLRAQEESGRAILLSLEGAVTPASADYVTSGILEAAADGAELVVLRMDTPGGLDSSMRDIIRTILASPVPVASWVGPSGARAASAGTYILYASHVAAMAPGTTTGAATPIQLGGGGSPFGGGEEAPEETEGEREGGGFAPKTAREAKVVNDAAAYIRGLAELRGRDVDWAERAVRGAESIGATEAAEIGVIDFVAPSVEALLAEADGMVVTVGEREVELATAGLVVEAREPGFKTRLLSILTDPNVAMILMVVGFYGIVFELINPGALVPGVIGAISLLTGFYALSVLPVNYAGVGLMLFGIALMVAEAFAPSFGILGIGGVIAFTLGSVLLIDTDVPGIEISIPAVAAVAVASAAFAVLVARLAVGSRRAQVVTGREQMVGTPATVLEWSGRRGAVHAHGERWQACGDEGLRQGDVVEIVGIDGLLLHVALPPAPISGAAERPAN